jgi:hypothetical protein
MAQVLACLHSNYKALSSNPSIAKNKKRNISLGSIPSNGEKNHFPLGIFLFGKYSGIFPHQQFNEVYN